MANNNFRCAIVSKFFLNTCLKGQESFDDIRVLQVCARAQATHPHDDNEVAAIPLSTGSLAEFHIQPMLSCIGDVDVMVHRSDELAIPEGTAPPTHLPAEFHSRVTVCDIIDSEFPGYVYLMSSYLLTECTDDGNYDAVQLQRRLVVQTCHMKQHGPAIVADWLGIVTTPIGRVAESHVTADVVGCIRCLLWPPQAADWPIRHRNYDWPDSATIVRVVSNGCDVVRVAHRQCRQDGWMSKRQRRLSFSRAEIVLINGWKPVQQIVYHMLRYFVKSQGLTDITDNTGAKILSNYNVKTLMLWACELKPIIWWTGDLNFIRIAVELLHTLAVWLNDARCQHYFIHSCNLMDCINNLNSACIQQIVSQLSPITETWLVEWFVNYCIHECARLCFDDYVCTDLQETVLDITWTRFITPQPQTCYQFATVQFFINLHVSSSPLTVRRCLFWLTELARFDRDLWLYFTAVAFLHVVHKTASKSLEDGLLDDLATMCLQSSNLESNDLRRYRYARHSSVLSLSQAAKLMKVAANNSRSTLQLIEIELSKAYLYRALRCTDSDSDSIYCLANLYLAFLYYATGQHQTAIDHCRLVTRSQYHSHCSSHVVQGELLLKIDNELDIMLGLAVFYQYVRTAALSQQQQKQHVSVFTTELFAHYLCVRCISVIECHQLIPSSVIDEVQRYTKFVDGCLEMYISDVLAFKSVCGAKYSDHFRKLVFAKHQTKPVTAIQLDIAELIELLKQSAIEHLTIFRLLEAQKFGSLYKIVTTDYEAMYAYKCGEYQRCLQLSMHNVRSLVGDTDAASASLVFAYPEFIQLMDDDIVSVSGLMLIVDPLCRKETGFVHLSMCQLVFSFYLMTQCQIKLHHPVRSLAQTLGYVELFSRQQVGKLWRTLDQLLFKLTERKLLSYISSL